MTLKQQYIIKRTFRSTGGFPFQFEHLKGSESWFYRVSKTKFFHISRYGNEIKMYFCNVPKHGKYMTGEKSIRSELVGIVHNMEDVCNGLVTYETSGAWWK